MQSRELATHSASKWAPDKIDLILPVPLGTELATHPAHKPAGSTGNAMTSVLVAVKNRAFLVKPAFAASLRAPKAARRLLASGERSEPCLPC